MHPRLLRTLAHIQLRFGNRRIEIVSGYRVLGELGKWDSYHGEGRAADIALHGVDPADVMRLCRALQRARPLGCGRYRGRFGHIDIRG